MENIKILENKEKNGVEIYFNTIPTKEIINNLKASNFKWHGGKKCWYAKATATAKTLIESLGGEMTITANEKSCKQEDNILKLKTLRKATKEEIQAVASREWESKRMQDYLIDNFEYYVTADNLFFEIEKANKLSISKTLYYDDEYDAPTINLENFIENNTHRVTKADYIREKAEKEYNKFYFIKNNETIFVQDWQDWEIEENQNRYGQTILRQATKEEIEDIIAIYDQQKKEYITRLTKYYNKYGKKHISTHGYWANR